jgi:hypothetical protein
VRASRSWNATMIGIAAERQRGAGDEQCPGGRTLERDREQRSGEKTQRALELRLDTELAQILIVTEFVSCGLTRGNLISHGEPPMRCF